MYSPAVVVVVPLVISTTKSTILIFDAILKPFLDNGDGLILITGIICLPTFGDYGSVPTAPPKAASLF